MLDFQDFMYKDVGVFEEGISSCDSLELICTSRGDSCVFLDLRISQSAIGLEVDIYDKREQPEYSNLHIIKMPHIDSYF